LEELKRRRVFRALVGYAIAAFAVLQVIEPVMHGFRWPDAVLSYVVVALAAGFPIVVGLAWIFDLGIGGIERTPPASAPQLRGTRIALVLAAIGAIAAAPVLAWYLLRGGVRGGAEGATWGVRSIAVLPFADMSPQKDQEYFSDGLSEEILNALAQVDGLHVAGRTSSASFKGKAEDLRSIGQKLGVATVLEGSVRKAESRVRVTAQLIDGGSGGLQPIPARPSVLRPRLPRDRAEGDRRVPPGHRAGPDIRAGLGRTRPRDLHRGDRYRDQQRYGGEPADRDGGGCGG
jgi:TolB-like protein